MRRLIFLVLRLAVAAAGIGYVLHAITWHDEPGRPGLWTLLRGANQAWLAGGLLAVTVLPPGQALRWWVLMRCRGLDVSYARALRLTMVGLFFNLCLPGATGGDVARAWSIARDSEHRAAAITSVLFDRLAGLTSLFLLAAMAGLARLDHPLIRQVTLAAWVALGCGCVAAWAYFSPRLRRVLGLHHWLAKRGDRHWLRRFDAAAVAYHHHQSALGAAIGLSMIVQIAQILAAALAGYALGITAPFTMMMVVLPLVMVAASIPLTYQGLGVMEAVGQFMLVRHGYADPNQIVAMLMLMRLYLVGLGLLGALCLLSPPGSNPRK